MSVTAGIEIRLASVDDQHSVALSARQREEILISVPDLAPFTIEIPIFVVLIRDGEPIACGGLRPLTGTDDLAAEMKRVYVIPEARGQANGVSDLLLEQLELQALERGWTIVRLQTGRAMHAANKFYERHGYRLIPNYGDYVGVDHTISYEKVLS